MLLTLDVGSEIALESVAKMAAMAEPSAKVVSIRAEPLQPVMQPPSAFQRSPHASPSIRRMSREFGIDLGTVRGSGPRGRILKEDLRVFVKAALSAPAGGLGETAGSIKITPWPEVDFSQFGKIERAQLSKIRKVSGANLARNSIIIPHVTNFEDADITDLDLFRTTLNLESRSSDSKITILPFLIKAAAATLAKFTTFNSSLDGEELILKHCFNIGFAADTPNGLVVPVIRDVDRKGIRGIAAEATALALDAREGKLKPADMQVGASRYPPWAVLAVQGSRPSSMPPKSPSWA